MTKKDEIIKEVSKYINSKYNLGIIDDKMMKDCINNTLEAINYTRCSAQLPDVYLQELSKIEWINQTQTDLKSQLHVLRQFANKLGLYDASDYLKK